MVLKPRDTEVLRFEWIEPEGVRIVSVNERATRFLPLDLHGQATDEGLWRWLKHRAVPRHRAYIAQFLSRLGIRNGDLRGQSFLDMKSEFQLRYRQKLAQRCRWNDVNLAQRERTL